MNALLIHNNNMLWPAAIAASICLQFQLCSCSSEVVHSVSEPQANKILSVLAKTGIAGEKARDEGSKTDGWRVTVHSGETVKAMAVLQESGLPRPPPKGFAETFAKGSIIPTPTEEKAMMIQAVTGELEKTLEAIDGVTLARVHVVLPGRNEIDRGKAGTAASAAVLLKVAAGTSPDGKAVRRLVARSVEGLSEDAVAVEIFENAAANHDAGAVGRPLSGKDRPGSLGVGFISLACGLSAFLAVYCIRRRKGNGAAASGESS